jgi:iron(III) transport system substrate-binding protein
MVGPRGSSGSAERAVDVPRKTFTALPVALLSLTLLVAACGGQAAEGGEAADADLNAMTAEQLEAAAVEEGEVSWFTTMYPTETTHAVADAFMKKYPGITVNVERSSTNEIWQKLATGMQAGSSPADVYSTTQLEFFDQGREAGYLDCYTPQTAKDLDPQFADPGGCWFASRTSTFTIVYNTDKVAPDEVPQTYDDLTAPRWKGKVGLLDPSLSNSGFSSYFTVSKELGDGQWQGSGDYWERMGANEPVLFPQGGPLINGVVSGEIEVGWVFDYRGWEFAADGAPVGVVNPELGVVPNSDFTALVTDTDQPHAARLFMDFLGSAEAMEFGAKDAYYYSVRPEIDALPADRPPLSELTLLQPDFAEQATEREGFLAMFAEKVAP